MKFLNLKKGLKDARKNANLTQQQLADKIGVTLKTVMNWEQGVSYPTMETLLRLAQLYDCDLDYLTGRLDCTRHDIQYIHDKTGLSEGAIRKLQELITPPDFEKTESDFKEMGMSVKKRKDLTRRERHKWNSSIKRNYIDIISLFIEDSTITEQLLYLITKRITGYDPRHKWTTYKELTQDDLKIEMDGSTFLVTKRNVLDSLIQSELAWIIPILAEKYHSNKSDQ